MARYRAKLAGKPILRFTDNLPPQEPMCGCSRCEMKRAACKKWREANIYGDKPWDGVLDYMDLHALFHWEPSWGWRVEHFTAMRRLVICAKLMETKCESAKNLPSRPATSSLVIQESAPDFTGTAGS